MEDHLLHRLVWRDRIGELQRLCVDHRGELESRDPRGRTPLALAVALGRNEAAKVLLKAGADPNAVDARGWSVAQEAVASGDPELAGAVLESRERRRSADKAVGIPRLLAKLKDAPDFYVEMKWEFTSWIPLLSRVCPSDVYKVYKRGSDVRVDTTLLGFDKGTWSRGNRSYIFSGTNDGAQFLELDHDARTVYSERRRIDDDDEREGFEEQIASRLSAPLVLTYLDTEKINFERNKTWGWGAEKNEVVSGYDCKVFSANDVELVTRTRTEHMSEDDKKAAESRYEKSPLRSFVSRKEVKEIPATPVSPELRCNPHNLSEEAYFDPRTTLDVGRPKEMTSEVQKFKANLWLSETYPLSLQEQITPIIEIMAISNAHFRKLKDFITCCFPSGFPVKIEIPLFHVLNARITFGNIFGLDTPVEGVRTIREDDRLSAAVDDGVFKAPAHYRKIGGRAVDRSMMDQDDRIFQYALNQSVDEEEEVDIYEALQAPQPHRSVDNRLMDIQIQRAIEASLNNNVEEEDSREIIPSEVGDDLAMAIALSQKEQETTLQREKEEKEMLERILALSMKEK